MGQQGLGLVCVRQLGVGITVCKTTGGWDYCVQDNWGLGLVRARQRGAGTSVCKMTGG